MCRGSDAECLWTRRSRINWGQENYQEWCIVSVKFRGATFFKYRNRKLETDHIAAEKLGSIRIGKPRFKIKIRDFIK